MEPSSRQTTRYRRSRTNALAHRRSRRRRHPTQVPVGCSAGEIGHRGVQVHRSYRVPYDFRLFAHRPVRLVILAGRREPCSSSRTVMAGRGGAWHLKVARCAALRRLAVEVAGLPDLVGRQSSRQSQIVGCRRPIQLTRANISSCRSSPASCRRVRTPYQCNRHTGQPRRQRWLPVASKSATPASDEVPGAIELVRITQVSPAFTRLDDREIGIAIAVRLFGSREQGDRLVDEPVEGRIRGWVPRL